MKLKGISDAGICRLKRVFAGSNKEQQLIAAIEKWLDDYRTEYRKFEEKYDLDHTGNPLADVAVWPSEKTKNSGFFGTNAVALVYDGDGYNDFSYESEMRSIADKNRSQLSAIAERYGYHMEDYSTWASLFYDDGY